MRKTSRSITVFKGLATTLALLTGLSWGLRTAWAASPSGYTDGSIDAPKAGADVLAYPDPWEGFNEKMLWIDLKLDQYIVHPVAQGFAFVTPRPARKALERFFDNVSALPRVVNNLLQLKFMHAGEETARFAINTTVGLAGFFDPADTWFGLEPRYEDMGLTLAHWGVPSGPYLVLPVIGPTSVRDAIGGTVDRSMNPWNYFPSYLQLVYIYSGYMSVQAVDYRSLNLDQFEQANRYAIDLYGAVQDAYIERRRKQFQK